jgi:adenylate cyclase
MKVEGSVPEALAQVTLDNHPVVRWLMADGRRIGDSKNFLEGFALCLRQAGIDVTRITTGVPILHPQIFSFSGLWQLGKGTSERLYRADASQPGVLENSPIKIAYDGKPVRCQMTATPSDGEFPILKDLRRDGITDYIVFPAPFSDGTNKAVSLATTRTNGFSDSEIALFAAMIPAFSFNLEVQTLRRMARTLLDTYVGRRSGGRVLEGQIKRGMGETIRAAIWLCDLRGFTSLSESLPRDELIEMLNQYFGPMCDAVDANNGEVLKFIGDAMLAIFPVIDNPAVACGHALSAALTAQDVLDRQNRLRLTARAPPIKYGIALHVGDVLYGNIGSETRLDFTVIGPAVNLTARIESLCRDLDRSLLLSADFVRTSGVTADPMGEFALKGVGENQHVFAPRETQRQGERL